MKKLLIQAAFLLVAVSASAQVGDRESTTLQATPKKTPALDPDSPRSLLAESYRIGSQFDPEQKVHLLTTLSWMSSDVDGSMCKEWAEELFRSSLKLEQGWDRVADEKNAATFLSAVDPIGGFRLLQKVEKPVPFPNGKLPEDVRADAATTVFPRYWRATHSDSALDELLTEATKLAQTGQFPYLAMAPMIIELGKTQSPEVDRIVRLAVSNYGVDQTFERTNADFVAFIDEIWPALGPSLRSLVVLRAATTLRTQAKSAPERIFAGHVMSQGISVQFKSSAEMYLFQLLPKIKAVSAQLAEEVAKDYPDFSSGADGAKASFGAVTIDTPSGKLSSEEAQATQAAALSASFVGSLVDRAASDPYGALATSSTLQASDRILVMCAAASALFPKDPSAATTVLSAAGTQLKLLDDGPARFAALVAYSEATISLQELAEFKSVSAEGFDLGEELLDEELVEHPGRMAYQTQTYPGLEEISGLAVRTETRDAIGRLHQLHNAELEADLLAEAAFVIRHQGDPRP